ncbi:hypothetical protein OAD62_02955 [Oceanihabitans sp.]|jgi:hypothetical protein|nr:hypothetical protein [Oceanihabitans sp.]
MLAGHYATALIAHQKSPKGTLLYFLIASQFQDLLWFTFHLLGLEYTGPNDVLDTTLSNMTVDMLYSHDLLPQIFWLVVIFLIGKALFKSTKIGMIGSALVAGHFVLDFFSGHPHHIFGAETQDVALGLYASHIYFAIAIEAVFCILILWYLFKKEAENRIQRTSKNKISIIGLFVFGIVFMLTIATTSFRQLLDIPEFDIGFNSNVPTLILTYLGMIFYLNYFVPKFKVD